MTISSTQAAEPRTSELIKKSEATKPVYLAPDMRCLMVISQTKSCWSINNDRLMILVTFDTFLLPPQLERQQRQGSEQWWQLTTISSTCQRRSGGGCCANTPLGCDSLTRIDSNRLKVIQSIWIRSVQDGLLPSFHVPCWVSGCCSWWMVIFMCACRHDFFRAQFVQVDYWSERSSIALWQQKHWIKADNNQRNMELYCSLLVVTTTTTAPH